MLFVILFIGVVLWIWAATAKGAKNFFIIYDETNRTHVVRTYEDRYTIKSMSVVIPFRNIITVRAENRNGVNGRGKYATWDSGSYFVVEYMEGLGQSKRIILRTEDYMDANRNIKLYNQWKRQRLSTKQE